MSPESIAFNFEYITDPCSLLGYSQLGVVLGYLDHDQGAIGVYRANRDLTWRNCPADKRYAL